MIGFFEAGSDAQKLQFTVGRKSKLGVVNLQAARGSLSGLRLTGEVTQDSAGRRE
jgi:hypothetical protein